MLCASTDVDLGGLSRSPAAAAQAYSSLHKRDLPLIGSYTGADTLSLRPWPTSGSADERSSFFDEMRKSGVCKAAALASGHGIGAGRAAVSIGGGDAWSALVGRSACRAASAPWVCADAAAALGPAGPVRAAAPGRPGLRCSAWICHRIQLSRGSS